MNKKDIIFHFKIKQFAKINFFPSKNECVDNVGIFLPKIVSLPPCFVT